MKRFFQILVLLFAVSISPALAQNKNSYKVGDYYNDGQMRGFVFYVDETGRSGKIISLQQTELPWYQGTKRDKPQKMGLENVQFGLLNLVKLRHNEGWHEKFPAFAWCADLGDGWYLPSVGEWQEIAKQSKVLNNVMDTFPGAHGGITGIYWSSNEDPTQEQRAWAVTHYGGGASMQKTGINKVRAVACFDLEAYTAKTPAQESQRTPQKVSQTPKKTTATQTATITTAKTYKVGDYYNDGTKEGVVFWVDATSKHGKIVSLTQNALQWCSAKWYFIIEVGVFDETDGKANTDKVMARNDSAEYPAFVWCRNMGKDWYLPAVKELEVLLLNNSVFDAVNRTLARRGATKLNDKGRYWSSTEREDSIAWWVFVNDDLDLGTKGDSGNVRAVATF